MSESVENFIAIWKILCQLKKKAHFLQKNQNSSTKFQMTFCNKFLRFFFWIGTIILLRFIEICLNWCYLFEICINLLPLTYLQFINRGTFLVHNKYNRLYHIRCGLLFSYFFTVECTVDNFYICFKNMQKLFFLWTEMHRRSLPHPTFSIVFLPCSPDFTTILYHPSSSFPSPHHLWIRCG